jgi:hypothetical protein
MHGCSMGSVLASRINSAVSGPMMSRGQKCLEFELARVAIIALHKGAANSMGRSPQLLQVLQERDVLLKLLRLL